MYNVSVEDVHSWTSRTIDLVARLTQDISSLNNHWGVFNSQREDYFGNMFGPAQQKLQVIQDTFLELAAYTKDFNDLKERCMMFSQEVGPLKLDTILCVEVSSPMFCLLTRRTIYREKAICPLCDTR